ncbi:MAG: ATPase associated with various cellular 3 [Bacilli bacterium]|jgi:MoxR-like ATPase|nr:ATPase associated with various cellular 3 [Bacilli bacterium]
METSKIKYLAEQIKKNINQVIVGKEQVMDYLLIALITSSHVLLEDVPGTGKTLLAKAMAKSLDATFKRIQFTPDLLPSDLTGINFFNQKQSAFEFRPGPIFSHILLADEINRATPRTQSSLLECMEERQVSIDGETRVLDKPFIVIATQNPIENQGTFPLPEAQLDRFLLKVQMGYPTAEENIEILQRFKQNNPLEAIHSVVGIDELIDAQQSYSQVQVKQPIYTYITEILEKTRTHADIALGVSPRGGQALLKAVQVYAILQGRDYVTPDDVKAMVKPVLSHRIVAKSTARFKETTVHTYLDQILREVTVPAEEQWMKG